ncbi:hypothetical protein [Deinococcus radiopugnans]|uniref:Uncharacterized protein n=1 Tax=Deinococcus radiopugnans ATCC 19172 TaxID=585398 RepID=A0A5C4Y932_9DEIO|nr:hypothetical protein [Deinococcus radiopugnans]MBB6017468.1 hypothetical protein [Deinococcus radiopugnans ATCC 19172]TNM71994.1 hypothetical protein FHR04_06425 [Deinococcus radiopugnans ATCC 19172]
MWAVTSKWDVFVLTIHGAGDNPHLPLVVAAVRAHITDLLIFAAVLKIAALLKTLAVGKTAAVDIAVPYQCSLERGKRKKKGGLHVHLMVPRGTLVPKSFETTTPSGVIVKSQIVYQQEVGETLEDLKEVLEYLRKPALAGAQEFRAHGPQHPAYLHAERLLDEALAACKQLGLSRLPRTVWSGHLPRLPPGGNQLPAAPVPGASAPQPTDQGGPQSPGAPVSVSAPGSTPVPRAVSYGSTEPDPVRITGDAAAAAAPLQFPSVVRSVGLLRVLIARTVTVWRAVCSSWSRR